MFYPFGMDVHQNILPVFMHNPDASGNDEFEGMIHIQASNKRMMMMTWCGCEFLCHSSRVVVLWP